MTPTPVPYPDWMAVPELTPLTRDEGRALAETLPVEPSFVIPYAGLRQGLDRAFVAGPRTNPEAVILQHRNTPAEPEYFGTNPEAGWSLLSRIPGWSCLNGSTEDMNRFAEIFAREVPVPFRRVGDLFYVLDGPPRMHAHPEVRRLGPPDISLLKNFGTNVWGNSYRTFEEMLTEGVVAGGLHAGRVVSIAIVSAQNPRYADVGVHTLEPFRQQGMSAAAAALVAREVRARGLTPIWSTGSHNIASQRVADKVGFRRAGQGEYLVFDDLSGGGFRPA